MYQYAFEKLEVWQEARRFVKEIYQISDSFPSNEKYGLSSQIQRAAVSTVSNIAEGVSRFSDKEKIRFIEISYGSLMEVYCQLCIAFDLGYVNDIDAVKLSINSIANKLNALKRKLEERIKINSVT